MSTLVEGQRFGRYRIKSYLGSGIAGESYKAEDMFIQRQVTLKLIHPWAPLSDAARRQFFREIQDISMLEHTYLATTLDFGETNEQLFIARSYIEHGSLIGSEGRRWYTTPLPIAEAINLAQQIAQPLHHIHSRGYTHGSLTLPNIQVQYNPYQGHDIPIVPILITDVGIAHFVRRAGKPRITFLPVTAAPEQIAGRATPASDQYALAVLTYFWLTGQLPFVGTPETIEQKKQREEVPSPTILNSSITHEQAGIIKQALSAYPEDRYPSIVAFTGALQNTITTNREPATSFVATTVPITPPLDLFSPATETLQQPLAPQSSSHQEILQPIPSQQAAVSEQSTLAPANVVSSSQQEVVQPETNELTSTEPQVDRLEALLSPLTSSSPFTTTAEFEALTHSNKPLPGSLNTGMYTKTSAYFIIKSPLEAGARTIPLEQEEITIGRAGSSDIQLDHDPLTSRHHARLKQEQGKYIFFDCQSAYGTTINGQKISGDEGYVLKHGDHIGIGKYRLIFQLPGYDN